MNAEFSKNLRINVVGCQRCQQNHLNLEFKLLKQPEISRYSHWAFCPTNQEPIMLRIEASNEKLSQNSFVEPC